jgi:hypothetical protein
MAETRSSVQTHYGSQNLVNRILDVLNEAGLDVEKPTVEMLNLVDQLHGGGLTFNKSPGRVGWPWKRHAGP